MKEEKTKERKMKKYQKMYGENTKIIDIVDCGTYEIVLTTTIGEKYIGTSKFSKAFENVTTTDFELGRISVRVDDYDVLIDTINGRKYLNSYWCNCKFSSTISKEELIEEIIKKYNIELMGE